MIPLIFSGLLALQQSEDLPAATSIRLAMTPKLNGVVEAEEWDPLMSTNGLASYLQWEPGSLYLAGNVPTGQQAKISVDLNGDGWIVGDDNIEITVSPELKVRRLIQDIQEGARWQDEPLLAQMMRVQTATNDTGWSYEIQWLGLNSKMFADGQTFNVRAEAVDPSAVEPQAFLPRKTLPVKLAFDRATGLPEGMSWSPDHRVRTVIPGEQIKLRLTFLNKGEGKVGRVDLRTMGFAALFTATANMPFPSFDKKNRAFVDYDAKVAAGAPFGFTRLTARLQREDGQEATIESSYQITDQLSILPNLKLEKGVAGTPRIIRGDVVLRSNTPGSLKGKMFFDLPQGWALRRGNDSPFSIYRARGQAKMIVELVSPQGVSGLTPIPIRIQMGEKAITQTAYLVIE